MIWPILVNVCRSYPSMPMWPIWSNWESTQYSLSILLKTNHKELTTEYKIILQSNIHSFIPWKSLVIVHWKHIIHPQVIAELTHSQQRVHMAIPVLCWREEQHCCHQWSLSLWPLDGTSQTKTRSCGFDETHKRTDLLSVSQTKYNEIS